MKLTLDHMARELAADLGGSFDTKLSLKASREVILTVFGNVAQCMCDGHELNIPGFGKFQVKDSPAREGRNPRTGETVAVPAKRVVKFLPAKTLKDLMKPE